MTASLNIGLVAYGLDRSKAFVRVPNERGRWILTDRSVVEVDCPHCKAVAGEPCRRAWPEWKLRPASTERHDRGAIRYHIATHVARRVAWSEKCGFRYPATHIGPHKLHITAAELAAINATEADSEE